AGRTGCCGDRQPARLVAVDADLPARIQRESRPLADRRAGRGDRRRRRRGARHALHPAHAAGQGTARIAVARLWMRRPCWGMLAGMSDVLRRRFLAFWLAGLVLVLAAVPATARDWADKPWLKTAKPLPGD